MPAVSVDTFFACSLMVIIVLSAMAGASRLLSPYIRNGVDQSIAQRYKEISRYILLNSGKPSSWGQDGQAIPEAFGLAKAEANSPYELDIDKVTRLNSENVYAVSYAQLFTSLKLSEVSFRLEVKPVFSVTINLTKTFSLPNNKVYQFEILTEKDGSQVPVELKYYVIAENYLDTTDSSISNGELSENVTISDSVGGPSLLIVFARSIYNIKVASYGTYAFTHNSETPKPNGTFLRLSPLNYSLTASSPYSQLNLSQAYALTFKYNCALARTSSGNQSATYKIPNFIDPSPILVALTGRNSTTFFAECVAYPQLPVQAGADFAGSKSLSNVFAYTYVIVINSAMYECTVWLGGPRE